MTGHHVSGHVSGGVPQIIGWPEDQFVAVMNSYNQSHRDNPVMRTIAGHYAEDDIAAFAANSRTLAPQPGSKLISHSRDDDRGRTSHRLEVPCVPEHVRNLRQRRDRRRLRGRTAGLHVCFTVR
ncbi:c-type cytochrome [Rhodopseudomonas sp. P2A-2r]|uniref:c-type cytochrome n=1 Tax=unclassified Rhodopseudomonas TaxID=2638247 RepID=UPI0022342332|nr:hypothetical protein [Rhodopseudomonas sp. P2A-2r]UZE46911.1 hypothetical protein ONR75_17955 [Rhodopseudomonas sp. P2A-2r]